MASKYIQSVNISVSVNATSVKNTPKDVEFQIEKKAIYEFFCESKTF